MLLLVLCGCRATVPAHGGMTGQGLVPLEPPAAPGALAPNLTQEGEDSLLLTWLEPKAGSEQAEDWRLRFSRLEAGAWSEPATLAEGKGLVANWADVPSMARGGDGTLIAHWAERSGEGPYAYDVILGRSTDGGKHWERLGPAHGDRTATEHGFVSLLADGPGVRAFWLDGRETASASGHDGHHARGAMTLRTAAVGALEAGELLDARVCDCCGTSTAMTSEGPVLVYRDRGEDELRDISLVRRTAGGWSPPQSVHADGWRVPGCPVNGPAVAARGRRVAVAWYTYAGDRPSVRLAFSEDAGASFQPPLEVDAPKGGRVPLGRVDVVLGEKGDALVSWLAAERERATLLVRRVTAEGQLGAPVPVVETSAERQSGFPRMERLGDTLLFAWTETGRPTRVRAARLSLAEVPTAPSRAEAEASASTAAPAPLAAGQPAPEYTARTLEGQPASLAAERGQVVLVNLWATWCEPCRFELPELAALHERHAARGLRVVGVSVDARRTASEVRDFVARRKLPYTFWHDPEDRISGAFGVTTLPASFLVDRQGTIVWSHVGAVRAEDPDLLAALEAALQAPSR
ncbi:MAG TPA: redoxin domain-containing protein [Archangium sp.]